MRRYAKYNDSGVEWIGDFPEGWGLLKIGFIGKLKSGNGFSENLQGREGVGDYPFFKVSDTNNDGNEVYLIKGNNYVSKKDFIENNWYLFPSNTIVFPKIGMALLMNKRRILNQPSFIDNNMMGFIPNSKIQSKFSYYLFKLIDFKNYCSDGTVPSIGESQINSIKVLLPSNEEQDQIVVYLDEKTSHIDKLLDVSKRKIDLLKEQRASIINQVVTKGLNPNAKMKHSGVEWIGDIPEAWGVNKVGNNTYVKGRIGWKGLKSEDFLDEGPYLVTGTDFNKDGTINWANIYHVSNERYDEDPFIQLKDNDVLITKDGTIGKVVYVGNLLGKTCLNSGIFLTRPTNGQYISRYFFWVLNSNVFKVFVYFNSNGATIQHLYQNVFINFKFPIPPLKEQEQIVAYLDEKTSTIDKSISIEERRIGLLKEYRQSIISNVITGKIKVIADE